MKLKGVRHMKRQLMMTVALAAFAMVPNAVLAQAPVNPPANQVNDPTGTPPGVMPLQNRNSTGFPSPTTKGGEPIETRAPEKADDKPVFAGPTRVPYRPSTPINVTTLTDKLSQPWRFAFL